MDFCIIGLGVIAIVYLWVGVGGIILMPFADVCNKLDPPDTSYNTKADTVRQMITWPYMIYKIYKYKQEFK